MILEIRDFNDYNHTFIAGYDTTAQSVITDLQNCPFLYCPLCLMNGEKLLDNSFLLWNLLSSSVDLKVVKVSLSGTSKGRIIRYHTGLF